MGSGFSHTKTMNSNKNLKPCWHIYIFTSVALSMQLDLWPTHKQILGPYKTAWASEKYLPAWRFSQNSTLLFVSKQDPSVFWLVTVSLTSALVFNVLMRPYLPKQQHVNGSKTVSGWTFCQMAFSWAVSSNVPFTLLFQASHWLSNSLLEAKSPPPALACARRHLTACIWGWMWATLS